MANSGAVWGIDIGQCALKALRCRPHEKDTNRLVVEAFDVVEYPKILSQPDANREELIAEALTTFLSRNDVKSDRVALAVPGESGLARFIKLPPVEAKKIPDIVKYEAKQQIPFSLDDVVWDYQPLKGASQEEGYALETEVGIFAMKKDQVARALKPLEDAGVEVDFIQLAPLALYNFVTFDRLNNLEGQEYNPEEPPASTMVLSLGADTSDLVITNGFRVWQRSLRIGGGHFTKALTKEMRTTFAKAEQMKRNAAKAEDPKAVFQAMRPVFSDLVSEVQRSIGFYMSNNRGAKIAEVVALGNTMKLPGLSRFLAQNLELPVKPVDEFQSLVAGSNAEMPQFKENILAFATAYGLCVQGLGVGQIGTNLLPGEIVTTRLIRSKKPWAVAAAALLLAGMAVNYTRHVSALSTVDVEGDWSQPISASKSLKTQADGFSGENTTLKEKFKSIEQIGSNLQSNSDGRLLWLELLKAVDSALPKDDRPEAEREKTAADVTKRNELHIESMDCQYFADGATWFSRVSKFYDEQQRTRTEEEEAAAAAAPPAEAAPAEGEALAEGEEPAIDPDTGEPITEEGAVDPAADPGAEGAVDEFAADATGEAGLEGEAAPAGPTGPGYVVQLIGHHFHNDENDRENEGLQFVRKTLIKNLQEGEIELPDGAGGMEMVSMKDLGIDFPMVVTQYRIANVTYDPNAGSAEEATAAAQRGMMGGGEMMGPGAGRGGIGAGAGLEAPEPPETWKLRRYDFTAQFFWKPTTRFIRHNPDAAAAEGAAVDETAGF